MKATPAQLRALADGRRFAVARFPLTRLQLSSLRRADPSTGEVTGAPRTLLTLDKRGYIERAERREGLQIWVITETGRVAAVSTRTEST